jgi:hypothetical protein
MRSEIERVKREGGRLYHDTRLAHPSLNPSFFNLGVSRSMYAVLPSRCSSSQYLALTLG